MLSPSPLRMPPRGSSEIGIITTHSRLDLSLSHTELVACSGVCWVGAGPTKRCAV